MSAAGSSEFDAIVIGAGHNGLTAAVILQQAGLRTVCLDAKRYAAAWPRRSSCSTATSSRSPAQCSSPPR